MKISKAIRKLGCIILLHDFVYVDTEKISILPGGYKARYMEIYKCTICGHKMRKPSIGLV